MNLGGEDGIQREKPSALQSGLDRWSVSKAWSQQRRDWRLGVRLPAHDYLPSGMSDDESLLDLLYGEIVIRRELGEAPRLEEYLSRYPRLDSELCRIFGWEAMLDRFSADVPEVRGESQCSGDLPTVNLSKGGATSRIEGTGSAQAYPPPESLGRYRIIAPLGQGGQALVFRAVHPVLQRDVVLKWCRDAGDWTAEQQQRLVAEGRLLARLEHPGIARIYDLEFHEGRPFLVMEFVQASDLEQWSERERPVPREAAAIVAELARALAYAQEQGALHLDIKPRNVLINAERRPVLIDFGMAQLRTAWSDKGADSSYLQGTLAFMAPEQAAAHAPPMSAATDVFGLGGVLFYLLTRKPLRQGSTLSEMLLAAQQGAWDEAALDQTEADAILKRICRQALSLDPIERPSSAAQLAQALDEYLAGTRDSPATRRAMLLAGLGTVAAAFVVAGVAWLASANKERTGPRRTSPDLEFASPPEVKIWRSVRGQARFVDLRHAVPLRQGDELKLTAMTPPNAFAAIAVFDAHEGWQRLALVESSPQPQLLRFPAAEHTTAPLMGLPGAELLLVVLRRDRPISAEDLPPIAAGPEWQELAGPLLIRLGPEQVVVEQKPRSFGPAVTRKDPLESLVTALENLRWKLNEKFEGWMGYVIVHESP